MSFNKFVDIPAPPRRLPERGAKLNALESEVRRLRSALARVTAERDELLRHRGRPARSRWDREPAGEH